jgi:hypothetical protein
MLLIRASPVTTYFSDSAPLLRDFGVAPLLPRYES